jgi:hypothetical protein
MYALATGYKTSKVRDPYTGQYNTKGIKWDAQNNGNGAQIGLDFMKNGNVEHYDLNLNNLLTQPANPIPLIQRLVNDFMRPEPFPQRQQMAYQPNMFMRPEPFPQLPQMAYQPNMFLQPQPQPFLFQQEMPEAVPVPFIYIEQADPPPRIRRTPKRRTRKNRKIHVPIQHQSPLPFSSPLTRQQQQSILGSPSPSPSSPSPSSPIISLLSEKPSPTPSPTLSPIISLLSEKPSPRPAKHSVSPAAYLATPKPDEMFVFKNSNDNTIKKVKISQSQ